MASDSVIRSARLGKQPRLLRRESAVSPPSLDQEGTDVASTEKPVPLEDGDAFAAAQHSEAIPSTPLETEKPDESTTDVTSASVTGSETLRAEIYAELKSEYAAAAEAERTNAKERGYEEGYRVGHAKGSEEYSQLIETYAELVSGARTALEGSIVGLTDIVAELAFEAAIKILGTSMIERDGVVAVVRELLDRASSSTKLLIRVSPQDYEILSSQRAKLLSGFETSQVEIISDDRVVLGGCLLETPSGNLDGRLEIQLQQFRDTLLAAKARWPDPDLGGNT